MTYNITLQYKIDADSPIEAQQKAIKGESQPSSVQCREVPTRLQRVPQTQPQNEPTS